MQKNIMILNCFLIIILCFTYSFDAVSNRMYTITNEINQDIDDLPSIFIESGDPIRIDNDTDFISLGCPGDGTPENPYRIENKTLIFEGYQRGVSVARTTKHFVIQNCYFAEMKVAIEISYVDSNTSIIRNNVFENIPLEGISIIRSNYTRIENNTGRRTFEGIYTAFSYYSNIVNNSFTGCYDYEGMLNPSGMKFYRSYNGSIINNTINNFELGIYTHESSGFLFENNTILYCRADGSIHLYYSSDMVVKRNLIYHNLQQAGLMLTHTHNCKILYNTIYNSPVWGIALIGSNHNKVHQNNFLHNTILLYGEQAYDAGINNTWYLWSVEEGNYWSDWSGTGPYEIGGNIPIVTYDQYPLSDLYGIELEDLYFPNTTNDDIYEENDYAFNNPDIALSLTHNLHYADVDFFRINLQKSWKYRFELEFDYNTIDLDFYLFNDEYFEAVFDPLNSSTSDNSNEWFTYITPDYGYYYIFVVGDFEKYKEINPTDYQLIITSLAYISPTITSSNLLRTDLFILIATIFIISFRKRIHRGLRNTFQK
ncbi:MAG: right-handed parallel beta-helix repeat-containing protein [Candidatus Heimdallarchaeota archaeon]|nr:right-handed parallel beta-helix repeat-containing protein [Candidatus Heimdallarchaeota archaeon]MCK4291143.1 right-handed parallel beta-helix repeat-containing protein [Candidatus Heimdallarchaeota archaeon]